MFCFLQDNQQRTDEIFSTNNMERTYSEQTCKLILTYIKGAFLGLEQILATEKPLKRMKNAFYFTLKALSVLKILTFLY